MRKKNHSKKSRKKYWKTNYPHSLKKDYISFEENNVIQKSD